MKKILGLILVLGASIGAGLVYWNNTTFNAQDVPESYKILDDLETYTITVEKGMKEGDKITLANSAADYIDKGSSDLVFLIWLKKHSFYSRKDNDLLIDLTISLKEALLGFNKKIKTLDNRYIIVKREEVTQPF